MGDDHNVADNDDPGDSAVAGFASKQRRALPDPDNPYRPELHVFTRIASMRRAAERIDRSPIAVTDADELSHADIDEILLRGGQLVPRGGFYRRNASGFVVLAERRGPAIVFLEPSRYPLRAPLSFPHADHLAIRLGRAVGEDIEAPIGVMSLSKRVMPYTSPNCWSRSSSKDPANTDHGAASRRAGRLVRPAQR